MDRRKFLLLSLATGGSMTIGRGMLAPALAAPAQPGESPYGPLLDPDDLGLRLPEGFESRVVKQFLVPIVPGGTNLEVGMAFPDGGATFATDDGGWILVSNSENPPPADIVDPTGLGLDGLGGVQAIRFAADGTIVDAYPILTGTRSNCAGGATPWGTWLSCEELDDGSDAANSGRVYECDPTGAATAVDLPALGRFKHENVTVDPVAQRLYQSEDLGDGLFYRFTPDAYPDLGAGTLEAAAVADDGSVTWLVVPDPECTGGVPCRQQPSGATTFDGGEGCVYDDGKVFLTTKGDDRVWMYDTVAETMIVLYDAADFVDPVLTGVDHIIVQPGTGNLVVAEDGGNLEAVMIRRDDFAVFPILQMTGPQHFELPDEISVIPLLPEVLAEVPLVSEVSGLAFDPSGERLYFNSQRAFGGITYEVRGPWLDALTAEPPVAPTTTAAPSAGPAAPPPGPVAAGRRATLPATGGGVLGGVAMGAAAAAATMLALRQRLDQRLPDQQRPDQGHPDER